MKAPLIRIFGWSWLGVVNFLIVQWFFVRIEVIFSPILLTVKVCDGPSIDSTAEQRLTT